MDSCSGFPSIIQTKKLLLNMKKTQKKSSVVCNIDMIVKTECVMEIDWGFRVLCKFFANGACLKGEHCEYSHDWKAPPNNVNRFSFSFLISIWIWIRILILFGDGRYVRSIRKGCALTEADADTSMCGPAAAHHHHHQQQQKQKQQQQE